jgi:hypothetical protein
LNKLSCININNYFILEKCSRNILEEENANIDVSLLHSQLHPSVQLCFSRMTGLYGECSKAEQKAMAKLFLLLSSDASIDSIIPWRFCAEVSSFILSIQNKTATLADIRVFTHRSKFYCPEVSNLILSSSIESTLPKSDIMSLLSHLVSRIADVHSSNVHPDPPIMIPGTYNPAKYGRAYYFNKHGSQVRKIRSFSIEKKNKVNFDDSPDLLCNKKFPVVSKKGTTYLFLWFCAVHGHCYGFHVIPGSEGRKDPAASLYTHSDVAPDDVLYDFACSFAEYSKNRESGYFANTRFFHDVFHGYSHKCTKAFRCNRLLGFNSVNSSICEQFNSYIQKIKKSAKLMSQPHFMLYLQFFIHLWNQSKYETFRKKLCTAVTGRSQCDENPLI